MSISPIGPKVTSQELNDNFSYINQELMSQQADVAQERINVKSAPYNAKGDGVTNDTVAIQTALSKGGGIFFPAGTYMVNAVTGLFPVHNTHITLDKNAILKTIPNNQDHSRIFYISNVHDVTIEGGSLQGDRYAHMDANGAVWKMWAASTAYLVGDIVYVNAKGYKCTVAGTSGTTAPSHTSGTATDGSVTWQYYVANVGEWGHGIEAIGSQNIVLRDINIKDCWGDGVLVSSGVIKYCTNVQMFNVICDNNRRQGTSVAAVKGFRAYGCTFKNTNGTLPSAGIDFEPDAANERIQDVYMYGLKTENNAGPGTLLYLNALDSTSGHVNFISEQHTDDGSRNGFELGRAGGTIKGSVKLIDSFYINNQNQGILLGAWSITMPPVEIVRPNIINCNVSVQSSIKYGSGISFIVEADDITTSTNIGNVHVFNADIRDTRVSKLMTASVFYHDYKNDNMQVLSFIDPIYLEIGTSSSTRAAFVVDSIVVKDAYKAMSHNTTGNVQINAFDYWSHVTNVGQPLATRTQSLLDNMPIGSLITWEVGTDGAAYQIVPSSTVKILPFSNTVNKYVQSDTVLGTSITLEKKSITEWITRNQVGTWTVQS